MLEFFNSSSDKWNTIVKSFKNFDVYYLKEYSLGFEVNGDGESMLFYFSNKNLKAINVVFKRDVSKESNLEGKIESKKYYDLITPYGYGGWILEGDFSKEDLVQLNNEYIDFCIKNNIVTEFSRLHPLIGNHNNLYDIYDIKKLGPTVSINLNDLNQIWNNYTSANRNKIRIARKNNVHIYWGRNENLLRDFIRLYEQNMVYDDADDYYYFSKAFYYSLLNDLKYNSLFFYAVKDEKIIAMTVILFSNKKFHYHLSGADIDYRKYAPNNLMLHEVITWANQNNMDLFHMGGGLGSKEDSLFKFKKSFNKETSSNFYIGKKIFLKDVYDNLVLKSSANRDNEFFPLYRS